jgi:hypothetical protein
MDEVRSEKSQLRQTVGTRLIAWSGTKQCVREIGAPTASHIVQKISIKDFASLGFR